MTHELKQRELVVDLASGAHEISRITDERIIGPVDYGWVRFSEAVAESARRDPDIFTWGGGPLAGSRIPGTRRLVFCAYSPQWQGFYVSSLGGGAYVMHRIGVNFIAIRGAAPQDSVLLLNHIDGEISVRLEPIEPDILWTGYANADGGRLIGFHALQQAVFDRYGAEYDGDWVRAFAVGPAARHTNQGVIGSNQIKRGRIVPIEDWAGRGGLGSRLLQRHHIAACIFGGEWEDPDLKDSREINDYFIKFYGQPMIKVDLGATEKYRYVPGFRTGGTFGVNMHGTGDNLFSFNYGSIFASDEERKQQHQHFIFNHYLAQFNDEVIEPKNFTHCGEPCAVACKKYVAIYKKDYEPYQALGPLCDVFDQRAAESLNHTVDAMGWDAIQVGGTVSWVMEMVHRGLLPPEDFGLPPTAEMRFAFVSSPDSFDVTADSQLNAEYAHRIVDMILFDDRGVPFRQGLRAAAKALDRRYGRRKRGERAVDLAVYSAHGEIGCMTPNQYWVPGMLSPMPMMGKYFVYYGLEFLPPRDLGKLCVQRMIYELFSEKSGVCRFHRKWVEAIIDEIISAHYEFAIGYKAHQFELARQLFDFDGDDVVFWEGERAVDIIFQFLEKWGRFGLKDERLVEG